MAVPEFPGSVLCPVSAVDEWIAAAEITEGPMFWRVTRWQTPGQKALGGDAVNEIIKKMAASVTKPAIRASPTSTPSLPKPPRPDTTPPKKFPTTRPSSSY